MKKQYKDLDLKLLRKLGKLDFAHFTFKANQCSCCYGPADMAPSYWSDKNLYEKVQQDDSIPFSYILFKNAENGSGSVTRNDTIEDYTCVSYSFENENQKASVIAELTRQLGLSYKVIVPEDEYTCIVIRLV